MFSCCLPPHLPGSQVTSPANLHLQFSISSSCILSNPSAVPVSLYFCPDIFLSLPSHLTFIPPAFTPGIFLLHTAWVLSRNDSLNTGQIPDSLGNGNKRSLSCRVKSYWSPIVQGWSIFCCSPGITACSAPGTAKCLSNTQCWFTLLLPLHCKDGSH